MIFAVDVYYYHDRALAAGILFDRWEDREAIGELTVEINKIAEYEPGKFYKRELPCILELLKQLDSLPKYIVIDGYVYLGSEKKSGLGKYLYDFIQKKSAVIGVAKNRFDDTPIEAEIYRGNSQRPLYITAIGISQSEAKAAVLSMYGEHRIPVMLKMVDKLSKKPDLNHA
jgi:deoxyribonuclease V